MDNQQRQIRTRPRASDDRTSGQVHQDQPPAPDGDSIYTRNALQIPKIDLPKGGGALKGIDEKFSVNAANGTASFTIPLPLSKPRGDFMPAISLTYNSGSGNSVFGLGWNLDMRSIQRKTDKVLPTYADAQESDVFLLSAAEDLVPALYQDGTGTWVVEQRTALTGEQVTRYRPRIESDFALIERITPPDQRASYWKTTSKTNVVTVYGRSATARIADPSDPDRVFKWLPELCYDDKGNCLEYEYVAEDSRNMPRRLSERNRANSLAPFANTYLKRIKYGNKTPYHADPSHPLTPQAPVNPLYFFEVVFDYGDHELDTPTSAPQRDWPCRVDPFSEYKAGFDIRTYRLCTRILLFHYFKELNDGINPAPYLVRSLDLEYRYYDNPAASPADLRNAEVDYPIRIRQTSYLKNGATSYDKRSLPPLDVTYQEAAWDRHVRAIAPTDLAGAPAGVSQGYQWVDLWSEGISGILTEQDDAWYYKRNLGKGQFAAPQVVMPKPSFAGVSKGNLLLQDLEADGRKSIVSTQPPLRGYFELSDDDEWQPFRAFSGVPVVNTSDPNTKFIDLNGDGRPDLIVSEENVFTWYPNNGLEGYLGPRQTFKPFDEEQGPALVFSDPTSSIYLAAMSGSGLTDIVRIRNGEVCYWPNLGYGRFGAKVAMDLAPVFDTQDQFNASYIHLADVTGTGATDIVYLGKNLFTAWLNLSGNAWSEAVPIDPFPTTELPNQLAVMDLLGNGTACVVWSSSLPRYADSPMRYVDLMGGRKPHLVTGYANNMGKEVSWEFTSSTFYYLHDRQAGHPWITKLPFPVQCVSKVTTRDTVTRAYLTSEYTYHHGYYDHAEREYRGFGMVEQRDSETFDQFVKSGASNIVDRPLHQAPVLTRTWYHTGSYFHEATIVDHFRQEFFQNPDFSEYHLPVPQVQPAPITAQERREAQRACKGTILRQETYGEDDIIGVSTVPYTAVERNSLIQMLQPVGPNKHAVFLTSERETISYNYERNTHDPRVSHTLNIEIDQYGNVLQSATVAYSRQVADTTLPTTMQDEQGKQWILYTASAYSNDVITSTTYRLRQQYEARTVELTGATRSGAYFQVDELGSAFAGAAIIAYEAIPDGSAQKRRLTTTRTLFLKDDLSAPLMLGQMDPLGLTYQSLRHTYTATLLTALYGSRVTPTLLAEGAYVRSNDYKASGWFPLADADDEWWLPSGIAIYPVNAADTFYMPSQYRDPFGNLASVNYYGDYQLLLQQVVDAAGNTTSVLAFDWRVLAPQLVQDMNDNLTEVRFDLLGLVVGTALRGKGAEADDFAGFVVNLSDAETANFFSDPATYGPALLQHATSRFVYDFSVMPVRGGNIVRETHYQTAITSGTVSKLQYQFEYSNGLGSVAMRKLQAEPGKAKQLDGSNSVIEVDTTPHLRWVGDGRTVLNNKGNVVKKYEPYFSVTHGYEDDPQLVEIGVSPVTYYDPLGRVVRTDYPNGTIGKAAIEGWKQQDFDQNDTVNDSDWYAERTSGSLSGNAQEHQAALKATVHYNTPSASHVDSMGRAIYAVAHNRFVDHTTLVLTDQFYATATRLDIEGHRRQVIDPRGNIVTSIDYDQLGNADHTSGMDQGERWVLNDCTGKPIYGWDSKNQTFHTTYDALRRPIQATVKKGAAAPLLYDVMSYGEGQPSNKALNLRGKIAQHQDQAGIETHVSYDFKGNLVEANRVYVQNYSSDVDWSQAQTPQPGTFTTRTAYDALNRPVRIVEPSSNSATASVSVPTYNESGKLQAVDVYLRGATTPTHFIVSIRYNEKRQRQRIDYANGTSTIYQYDDKTFRLIGVVTARGADPQLFWDDPSKLTLPVYAGIVLQFLTYTFDPVGNITYVRDDAQQTIYFNNTGVDPSCDYTYDATYRLTQTIGREHIGQHLPPDPYDAVRMGNPQPGDMTQMQTYTQQYDYDDAGNMLLLKNVGSWSRGFTYAATNNQMLTAEPGGAVGPSFTYTYDEHGNMTAMPHLSVMQWDFKDRLRSTTVSAGGGGTSQQAWYAYDASGQRVRKVVVKGSVIEERLYLSHFERFRRFRNGTLELERETLHVTDDTGRIAMVDMPTLVPVGNTETQLIRYQYTNHLGTACLEVDDTARIISYEEYYAFGSTSYQATDTTREIPAKRYRYTSKERDEESGLYYHGARYYAPWLVRWTTPDPKGVDGGLDLYVYANNNPVMLRDPNGRQPDPPTVTDTQATLQPQNPEEHAETGVSTPTLVDRGAQEHVHQRHPEPRNAGSSANSQYLTNGNPPGNATQPGRRQGEVVLGAGGSGLGTNNASAAGSQTVAERAGLFLLPNGLGGEYGVVAIGSFLVPSPQLLALTLHVGDPHFGVYAQAGQITDAQGRNPGVATSLTVAQGASFNSDPDSNDQNSIYVNESVNQTTSNQQVAGRDVTDAVSATVLVGTAYNPSQRDPTTGRWSPGPNAVGGEVSAAINSGTDTGGAGSVRSTTATALLFYTHAYNDNQNLFGVAVGASYETGGGGTTIFARFAIALDRPAGSSVRVPDTLRFP